MDPHRSDGDIYGDRRGGMAGLLRRLARLPIVPIPTGDTRQFPVHEDDFVHAIGKLIALDPMPPGPIGVASARSVSLRFLLDGFARADGRRPRFLPIPWHLIYGAMRIAELLPVRLPFRSDSLLGLVQPARVVPGTKVLDQLGVTFRAFDG